MSALLPGYGIFTKPSCLWLGARGFSARRTELRKHLFCHLTDVTVLLFVLKKFFINSEYKSFGQIYAL